MNKLGILTKGFFKENPTLVLLLGCCPFLATTTSALNGLGMGGCTLAVLFCSNIIISILKNVIPDNVRIPCYIVVIASLVTVVQMLMQAFLPELNKSLGLYIPLIVVNCIILGRAEGFANHNSVIDSALDGLGMGIGFTIACFLMGSIREILGAGTIFGVSLGAMTAHPMIFFMLPAGGFFVFGLLNALIRYISEHNPSIKPVKDFSCAGCLMAGTCEIPGATDMKENLGGGKLAEKAKAEENSNGEERDA
ncbi:MAG: electron transport complex subunit RsxE [Anaerovoracaceae bacterium]|jgi:electron transport complex protein RnfE